MTDLSGKTALITGASRGIGAAAAQELAKAGARVVLMARSGGDIERLAADIGERALAVTGDVARFEDMERAVATGADAFGAIDILVNNAGLIDPIARLDASDPAAWGHVVDVNLKGVYHGIRAVLPAMCDRGAGTIINISSGAATNALEGWSHYCATKAAVLSLTRSVHKEYAAQGIACVGLSPGTVATDMQVAIRDSGVNPVSTMAWEAHIPPQWVGQAIVWLCSDAARVHDGGDFSLKTSEGRRAVGLPEIG